MGQVTLHPEWVARYPPKPKGTHTRENKNKRNQQWAPKAPKQKQKSNKQNYNKVKCPLMAAQMTQVMGAVF